jgi:hypothetical protein
MHATDPTPEERLARAQLNHLLEQLVDGLPETYRTVFVLREVQQLSTSEVAEALGLNPDNVKQRLSRAKAMLRTALEERTGTLLTELYPFEARGATASSLASSRPPAATEPPPREPRGATDHPSAGPGTLRFWYASAAGPERARESCGIPPVHVRERDLAGRPRVLGTGADSVKAYSAVLHKKPNDAEALAALEALLKDESVRAEAARALIPAYEAVKEHRKLVAALDLVAEMTQDELERVLALQQAAHVHLHHLRQPELAFAALSRALRLSPADPNLRTAARRAAEDADAMDGFANVLKELVGRVDLDSPARVALHRELADASRRSSTTAAGPSPSSSRCWSSSLATPMRSGHCSGCSAPPTTGGAWSRSWTRWPEWCPTPPSGWRSGGRWRCCGRESWTIARGPPLPGAESPRPTL